MTTPTLAEPIALIDMDGTLADFDFAMRRDLAALASPEEWDLFERAPNIHSLEEYPWWKARMSLIKRQPGWWRELPTLVPGMTVYRMMLGLGFRIMVLTKGPVTSTNAWTEKVEWCHEHLPEAQVSIVEDKSLVFGKILMDDYPPYIKSWQKWRPRGLVLMPAQPWNEGAFSEDDRVLRFTGSPGDLDRVLEAIQRKRSEICGT